MTKKDKIESYFGIYMVIFVLILIVGLWLFLICFPPIAMVLNKPNWVIAFAICYPSAVILLPPVVFGVYCGYQYIKEEISEIKGWGE